MKFYIVHFDAMPYNKNLELFSNKKKLDFHHQVTCCFSFSSVFSLLTGYLPSQVFDTGLGYRDEKKVLEKSEIQIFDKLDKNHWDIFIHNVVWMQYTIYNKDKFNRTTSIAGGIENEISGVWCTPDIQKTLCQRSQKSEEMIEREIEHIKRIQSNKSDKNEFHYIMYHHFHEGINTNSDLAYETESIFRIMEAWNFEEEDAVFWFFADHGDFTKIDVYASPPHAWTTWAITRDNITGRKSDHGLISIIDFLPSFYEQLGIDKIENELSKSIYSPFDKERTYYLEDSRSHIDLNRSVTACAINGKKWQDNTPLIVEQTSFFKNEFKTINFDFNERKIINGNKEYLDLHKNILINIFKWMN